MTDLPKYEGRLTPAPWSAIALTEPIQKYLKAAALADCKACFGRGYHGDPCPCRIAMLPSCDLCMGTAIKPGTAQACRCTNRPPDPR